jgi:hypothetical protein
VLPRLAYLMLCRSIQLLALLARGDAAKDLEILLLRHQLTVLRRQTPRPKLQPADRALLAAVSRVLPRTHWSSFLVRPETLLRWHRQLVKGVWTYPRRGPGRPPLDPEVQQLIVRLAKDNPAGATSASKENCCASGCGSQHPRSAAPSAVMDWTRPRAGPRRPGGRSCGHCCICCERALSRQTVVMRPCRPRPATVPRSAFAGFCFPPEVIVLAVRWYLRFGLSSATSKNCSPNAVSKSTTSPSSGGCSGSRRCWLTQPGPAATLLVTAGRSTRPM